MKGLALLPALTLLLPFLVAASSGPVHVDGERLKGLLLGLAEVGRNPEGGVSRLGFSKEDLAARAEWAPRSGLEPARIGEARLDPARVASYIELHIEQGGVLDRGGVQIGVVQGIVGIDRYHVTLEGFANHAGTTPMADRRDALVAGARLILAVREEVMARPGRQVGNVGYVQVLPGAPNVVPGLVRLPVELRDLRREVIDDMAARVRARAEAIGKEAGVAVARERYANDGPAPTDPGRRARLGTSARA